MIPLISSWFKTESIVELPNEIAQFHNQKSPYLILYFGYSGCSSECPVTLSSLSQVLEYSSVPVSVIFIDLLNDSSSDATYASQYNPEFITIPYSENIHSFMEVLSVWWFKQNNELEPIKHSDRLYLLEKKVDKSYYMISHFRGSSEQMPIHLSELLKNDGL